jgi:hypothetical protein
VQSAGGDTRVPACDLVQSRTEVWRGKDLFFFFFLLLLLLLLQNLLAVKQAKILAIHYLVADGRCSFQSVFLSPSPSANYENVMIIWFCWDSGITDLSTLFSIQVEHDRWAWVPGNGRSATVGYLQHHTYEFAHLAKCIVSGDKRRKKRRCNWGNFCTEKKNEDL